MERAAKDRTTRSGPSLVEHMVRDQGEVQIHLSPTIIFNHLQFISRSAVYAAVDDFVTVALRKDNMNHLSYYYSTATPTYHRT